jgi:hypothetical protein
VNKPTAAETYRRIRKNIVSTQLNELRELLASHATKQLGKPGDWSLVGDLEHVTYELAGIIATLKGED